MGNEKTESKVVKSIALPWPTIIVAVIFVVMNIVDVCRGVVNENKEIFVIRDILLLVYVIIFFVCIRSWTEKYKNAINELEVYKVKHTDRFDSFVTGFTPEDQKRFVEVNQGRVLTLFIKIKEPMIASWIWKSLRLKSYNKDATIHGVEVFGISDGEKTDELCEASNYIEQLEKILDDRGIEYPNREDE